MFHYIADLQYLPALTDSIMKHARNICLPYRLHSVPANKAYLSSINFH